MTIRPFFTFAVLLLAGCGKSGPASTQTNSSKMATVQERVSFLNQYVTFRRTYETLDFEIKFQNNGDALPGPSYWDIRLIATVPASELQAWVPQGAQPSAQDKDWLKSIPTNLDLSGLTEWYGDGHRIVGIDRQRRIIAYRAWAH